MANIVTLAVAGSRKTQGLVEHCASLASNRRVAVITYTKSNQVELEERLIQCGGRRPSISVMGWYGFLLRHFAKPFLPMMFRWQRVLGLNFEGVPHRFASGRARFLDAGGAVYACQLGRLAFELIGASGGALLHRLACLYDELLIDEVQDLSGYDWDIMDALLQSKLEIRMVGDIRQAVLSTDPRGMKNKQYADAKVIRWFRERQQKGILRIEERSVTWRCHPDIAAFSDTIFDDSWGFPPTQSKNELSTEHDGVFIVHPEHVPAYVRQYQPRCLRESVSSGRGVDLQFVNFGLAKGATFDRVLIVPTAGIRKFIRSGVPLSARPASRFYVAVTRAAQSVGIVLDDRGNSTIPVWQP